MDKNGNDLHFIEKEILSNKPSKGLILANETAFKKECIEKNSFSLKNNSVLVKEYSKDFNKKNNFHISILDIDETGYINFERIIQNDPITKPLICKPYDVLISCINPRIWRAAIIPEIYEYTWTCSSEFAVFRTSNYNESIKLYFSIMQKHFREQALTYAKGTSSSRQRINKAELLNISLYSPTMKQMEKLNELIDLRKKIYLDRLRDLNISLSLWC